MQAQDLANEFVRNTEQNLFLTGKAGTGKTTFLHQLTADSPKNLVVTSPTGVAATNAGGVTLHSFFQLSLGPCLPDELGRAKGRYHRFSKSKLQLMQQMSLLIIDEISMVRADQLDAVDQVLRRTRHNDRPFGGVQLLLIGDLQQLQPVIKPDEWEILQPYYPSVHFFHSHALQRSGFATIELETVYRQSDEAFIGLLNKVRENNVTEAELISLNSRYSENNGTGPDEPICLTTHNRQADKLNAQGLASLAATSRTFNANLEGEFLESYYPTEAALTLKEGAKVMFVRNDPDPAKQYFNGKLGTVLAMTDSSVTVRCDDKEIVVTPITWEQIRYQLDPESGQVNHHVLGKFSQLPLRLAWAITIHKSQGLTFETVQIDAKAAFSPGQVYVALSRCRSLNGLTLSSPLPASAIRSDPIVVEFHTQARLTPVTEQQLHNAKLQYQQTLLQACFDFSSLRRAATALHTAVTNNHRLLPMLELSPLQAALSILEEGVAQVGEKFQRQLSTLVHNSTISDPELLPEENASIQMRVKKAVNYFSPLLNNQPVESLLHITIETDNQALQKRLQGLRQRLRESLLIKRTVIEAVQVGFTVNSYLRGMNRGRQLAAHQEKPKRTTSKQIETDDVNVNTELFQKLSDWRAVMADKLGVKRYQVLHQRVLVAIAHTMPQNETELLAIHGIGKKLCEKFGNDLLELVVAFK